MQQFKTVLLVFLLMTSSWVSAENSFLAQCGMCHGADGNSSSAAAPTIAGITEYYFKYTMDAYKNDARKSDIMKMYAAQLTDKDLQELAVFYAKQKPQAAAQEAKAELAKAGKRLHQTYCEKCHSNDGGVSVDGYGVLAGQWSDYLRLTLKEYESGSRRCNSMMLTKIKKMRKAEGDQAIEQLINYYAGLK